MIYFLKADKTLPTYKEQGPPGARATEKEVHGNQPEEGDKQSPIPDLEDEQ